MIESQSCPGENKVDLSEQAPGQLEHEGRAHARLMLSLVVPMRAWAGAPRHVILRNGSAACFQEKSKNRTVFFRHKCEAK